MYDESLTLRKTRTDQYPARNALPGQLIANFPEINVLGQSNLFLHDTLAAVDLRLHDGPALYECPTGKTVKRQAFIPI
jgi:hypothetical protein